MLSLIENVIASKGFYQELLNPICKKYNLTESEILILLYLAKYPKNDTASKIVNNWKLKKAVVSVSIHDLLERGLLESSYQDGNHRSIHLSITDKGQRIIKEARKVEDKYFEILFDGFDDSDKKEFMNYLNRINENVINYSTK